MRQERDSLGVRDLPDEVYYGIQTLRAMENFPVTGRREPPELVRAYALVKQAAALANLELGILDRTRGGAIASAAAEVAAGGLADQFPVDIFQAGAGTSFNMNVNEVIANRALEILGRRRGEYEFLGPNDHVNLSQSSNDTFPTASHLAVIGEADSLVSRLRDLGLALERKGEEFRPLPKTGRTHLMDALPVTLGDEFRAYSTAVSRAATRIRDRRNSLLEVALGGTATGTGAGSPTEYREAAIRHLSRLSGLPLFSALDSLEALQSRSQLAAFSGALRELALELIRIANDLRLLGSGPTSGLDEIHLPPVQPGSSIMPGKVNPVMAECLDMIAFQVIGNDAALALAVQAGQLELNVMTPLMVHTLLDSLGMLNRFLPAFTDRCIDGIAANEVRLMAYLRLNPSLATLLSARIGYLRAARLAEESLEKKRPVRDLAVEKGILSKEEADSLFDLRKVSRNQLRDGE
ncbi:MAG: aspartate ammonia-lyase [Methanomicrobiales archaeon]|nr:aspartate ammonia-lyase [Methanomicrobiales archaeon]